ncbi:MAG: alpha/beta hydrolase [Thermoanaerobaculia bacterium]
MLRRVVDRLLLLAVAGAVVIMVFRQFTDSMIFYPERGQSRSPSALGLSYEKIWLDAHGDRIQTWWVAGESAGPVIVMFHGNAGTIADRLENVYEMVSRLGVTVLQVEYPGYGDSEGRPTEKSLFATGEAALREARARAGARPVVAFGRSLGGAVALEAATRIPVDAIIIESSFTTLGDMAASTGIPLARLLVAYRFDALAAVGKLEVPLLIVHGDRDEVVPYEMAGRLFDAAPTRNKAMYTVEGGTHNTTWLVGGEGYWRVWTELLAGLDS